MFTVNENQEKNKPLINTQQENKTTA